MHNSERILIVGEVGLIVLGSLGLVYNQPQLAYTAVGGFIGLLVGHVNGRRDVGSA